MAAPRQQETTAGSGPGSGGSSGRATGSIRYVDHFSLGTPSTSVRYRNATVRIYGGNGYGGGEQFQVVEEHGTESSSSHYGAEESASGRRNERARRRQGVVLTVKRLQAGSAPGSFGLRALRSAYALVSLVVFAFLVVFGFQILIYLVFNMMADARMGDAPSRRAVAGAVSSVPAFLYSISGVVSLGWTFVVETWSGHSLLRNLFRLPAVTTEWICFAVFLGLPGATMTAMLFADDDGWWDATALTWLAGVTLLGVAFGVSVLSYEVKVCSKLIRIHDKDAAKYAATYPLMNLLLRAVHLSHCYLLSGVRRERYIVHGSSNSSARDPSETRMSPYSHLAQGEARRCGLFYEALTPHQRVYSMSEVSGVSQFVTRDSWSLDAMFCSTGSAPMIAVTGGGRGDGRGGGALEPVQIKSTLVCQLLGSVLVVLGLVAFMTWTRMGVGLVLFVSAASIVCCIAPLVHSTRLLYRNFLWAGRPRRGGDVANGSSYLATKTNDEGSALLTSASQPTSYTNIDSLSDKKFDGEDEEGDGDGENNNGTLLQVWETVRVARPRKWLCYALFAFEVIFLWLSPAVSLFVHGNIPVGVAFVALGCFAFLRLYFGIESIVTELGPLHNVDITRGSEDGELRDEGAIEEVGEEAASFIFREKARISEVVGKVGKSSTVLRWMWGYGFVVAYAFFMAYTAASSEYDTQDYKVKGVTFAPGFHYPPRDETNGASGNLPYPTCHLTKGFEFQGDEQQPVLMEDFAFLAAIAYAGPGEAQDLLDAWFGPGRARDEHAFVDEYRTSTASCGGASYKLFSFPGRPGHGVVSIRGSEFTLDWMANVELWSAGALLQLVRDVVPLGQIWTPILHQLAYLASFMKSGQLRKVDYYSRVTNFVNHALASGAYHTLRITGVSLGGGLAIISGAQTGCSTVAISGPNAMISRKTFVPPLTEEQLNTRILNVIPDRDPVAAVDDPGRLYQRIACRAPNFSWWGCHSMWRSLCEFAYQCGSEGRPIHCWCVSEYGYPPPVQNGNVTWEDACSNA